MKAEEPSLSLVISYLSQPCLPKSCHQREPHWQEFQEGDIPNHTLHKGGVLGYGTYGCEPTVSAIAPKLVIF